MKSTKKEIANKPVPDDQQFLIVDKMESFIKDMQSLILYAEVLLSFPRIPLDGKNQIQKLLQNMRRNKNVYEQSLKNETIEDLRDRQFDILHEMEILSEAMLENEIELDKYLFYIQDNPEFRFKSKFKFAFFQRTAFC